LAADRRSKAAPEPPWLARRATRRQHPPLDRGDVVAAARRVAAAEGFAGLTMRRVADELGGRASSLYWHIRDKGQLVDLVIDELVAEVVVPGHGSWSERLVGFAHDNRRTLARYPGLAQLILERGASGPHAVEMAEAVLGILRQAGLDDSSLWDAYHTLLTYITGFVLGETWPRHPEEGRSRRTAAGAYLDSLPIDRFPNISIASRNLVWDDDARFAFGLEHLVFALGALAGSDGGSKPRGA
jgi:TetR/AcrR family tetracycline transcriptional repressor